MISYFLVLGGLAIAATAYALSGGRTWEVALAAFAGGAAIGGFYAGRASPHRALLEPALAGALVVGSIVVLIRSTTFGPLLFAIDGARLSEAAWLLAGCGFGGGALGTVLGELTQPRAPVLLPLRFVVVSLLVTVGALAAAGIAAGVLVIDAAAQEALANRLRGAPQGVVLDDSRLVLVAATSLASAAFVSGLVAQLAAPRRMLLPSALGPPLAVAGGLVALGLGLDVLRDLVAPGALVVGTAFVVAWIGALVAFVAGRTTGRLS